MRTLQRRLVRVAAAAVAITALFSSGSARASVVYEYLGDHFETASGTFSTTDRITGFVEFATAPTSGEIDKSDVSAFSFTAGLLTIDSTNDQASGFSFNFDTAFDIVNWGVVVIGMSGTANRPLIRSCVVPFVSIIVNGLNFCPTGSFFEEAIGIDSSMGRGANTGLAGEWTLAPVPVPAALPLFLSALAGLGLMGWRRRQAGA